MPRFAKHFVICNQQLHLKSAGCFVDGVSTVHTFYLRSFLRKVKICGNPSNLGVHLLKSVAIAIMEESLRFSTGWEEWDVAGCLFTTRRVYARDKKSSLIKSFALTEHQVCELNFTTGTAPERTGTIAYHCLRKFSPAQFPQDYDFPPPRGGFMVLSF